MKKDDEHLLCFVTDDGGQLFIHADATGLDLLIKSLSNIRKKIDENDCDHDHLMTESWGGAEKQAWGQVLKNKFSGYRTEKVIFQNRSLGPIVHSPEERKSFFFNYI